MALMRNRDRTAASHINLRFCIPVVRIIETFYQADSLIRNAGLARNSDGIGLSYAERKRGQAVLPGDDGLIPDCIPFSSIPHTTKLFSDFLSYSPEVRRFFPHPPDSSRVASLAAIVPHGTKIHAAVADALEKQNRNWGASELTLRNIQRLREGAHAVVTGQQVGLFGGPLLSLFKVASVLALAKQVEAAGVACVPVFWLASEDHDLAEVNQALLLTPDFQLAPFTARPRVRLIRPWPTFASRKARTNWWSE